MTLTTFSTLLRVCHLICCLDQHFSYCPCFVDTELQTAQARYRKNDPISFWIYPHISLSALDHYSLGGLSLGCAR
jgi:hypothetical protein